MRRGFTLLEIMVALVVTGLVVTLAYSTAQAGLDTGNHLTMARERDERAQVFRATLTDALRHAVKGVRGGVPVFSLSHRSGANGARIDSLSFDTRGVQQPLGASGVWRVAVWGDGSGVHLLGEPLEQGGEGGSGAPIRIRVGTASSLSIEVLGRTNDSVWSDEWSDASLTPDAVAFTLGDEGSSLGNGLRARTVVRVGLERAP